MNRLTVWTIVGLTFCACPGGSPVLDGGTPSLRDSGTSVVTPQDAGPASANSGTASDGGTIGDGGSGPATTDGGTASDSGTHVIDAGPGSLTGHVANLFWALPNQIRIADPDPASHLSVLVPLGDGGFIEIAAHNTGDGGFEVPGVPAGDVIVRDTAYGVAPNYVVTSARDLDLDQYTLGRPGLTEVDYGQTISISATQMQPSTDPTFSLTGANTGFYGDLLLASSFSLPVSSISNEPATFDFFLGASPDGTSGDTVFLLQTAPIDAGVTSSNALAIVRAAALTGSPVILEGASISAQLTSQPAPSSAVTVRQASFLAYAGDVVATAARAPALYFAVVPSPRAAGMPDLWVTGYSGEFESFTATASTSDLAFSTHYVDVYPSAWGRLATVQFTIYQSVQVPGGTATSFGAYLSDSKVLAASVDFSLRIGPPTAVKIDGQTATTSGTLGSLTPTLSWSAPAIGTPQAYQVRVYELTVGSGGTTRRSLAANLLTKRLSISLPPGVLSTHGYYVFIVEAYLEGPASLLDHPYWAFQAFDSAVAQSATARWSAP